MLIATLSFIDKTKAPALMDEHKAWIRRGFDDGVFLLTGNLQPNAGGAILAHGVSREEFEKRIAEDPFVAAGVVRADILEIAPSLADKRLAFLKG